MTSKHWWAVIALLAALVGCTCALLLSVRATVVCLPQMTTMAQNALLSRADRLQTTLDALPDRIIPPVVSAAQTEIRHGVNLAGAKLDTALKTVDDRSGQILDLVDRRTNQFLTITRPVLGDANELIQQTSSTVAMLRPQALGSLAAFKRAMGETAQAAIRIDAELPRALKTWDQIGQNVVRASDESAKTAEQSRLFMANLAQATKPLPAWVRIGLSVAPPLVQTGFTAASWMALKGKQK